MPTDRATPAGEREPERVTMRRMEWPGHPVELRAEDETDNSECLDEEWSDE